MREKPEGDPALSVPSESGAVVGLFRARSGDFFLRLGVGNVMSGTEPKRKTLNLIEKRKITKYRINKFKKMHTNEIK